MVVEKVEQTAAVAKVVAMAFEEHEGGHTNDRVVDGDGVAQWLTVTVGTVKEGVGEDGFNERLEERWLSECIVGSRTNDRRAGLWPGGAQTSCFATAAAAGPAQAHACHTESVNHIKYFHRVLTLQLVLRPRRVRQRRRVDAGRLLQRDDRLYGMSGLPSS